VTDETDEAPTITGAEADLAFKLSRARKTDADARLAEIEVQRLKGSLVATVDVVAAWGGFLSVATSRLFAIPTKAGAQLAQETDKAVIEDYLETLLRDAIEEIMQYQPEIDPAGRSILTTQELGKDEKGMVHKRARSKVKKDGTPAKKPGTKPGTARGPYKKRTVRRKKR
jgi:hypothetical protein